MEVDEHLRIPAAVLGDASFCLLLRCPAPIAIHVDQVVVVPAARPRLGVLECIGIRIGRCAARADVPLDVALASIGVQQRIDDYHDIVENFCRVLIVQKRAGDEHRRLARRGLVSVHTIREPNNRRRRMRNFRRTGRRRRNRIGEGDDALTDCVERRAILLRCDHREHERPVLICFTKLMYGNEW